MALKDDITAPIRHTDRFYIGGEWVAPSSGDTIDVIDSGTEEHFFSVAEARAPDMDAAVTAARKAFDEGPWPRMTHAQRAEYLRALGAGLAARAELIGQIWPRESGVLHRIAGHAGLGAAATFAFYAGLADTFEWEREAQPSQPGFGLLVREPVGVVGAIIPWNGPISLISYKVAPALIAGCTVVLKSSPEAPGEGYLVAEVAEEIGLPPGVLNVVTADREVSEQLVRDPRVDKITFTGSTAAGRRIASICGERIARVTLELGGKSAAVVLDDADLDLTASRLAQAECMMTGQVCSSLTRIVVSRNRHDELVEALADRFSQVKVGNQFDPESQMGPLAVSRQRDRVLGYIERGKEEGATLVTGGGRPAHLPKGWFVEPTLFVDVDNSMTIAQEEIFGPVLAVIPYEDDDDAVRIANESNYGLSGGIFSASEERATALARRIRTGSMSVNGGLWYGADSPYGGYKASGIGRQCGVEGLEEYLETKAIAWPVRPG